MPFDGSGNYVPPGPPTFPAVTATTISSAYFNATINDIGTALSNCLTRDNQGKPSVNMNWNGYNLTNVGNFSATGAITFTAALTATTGAFSGNLTTMGSLGIGTLTPAAALDVAGEVRIYPAVTPAILRFGVVAAEKGKISFDTTGRMSIESLGTEAISVLPSRNVGIGVTTPVAKFEVASAAQIARLTTSTARGSGNGYMSIYDPTGEKGYLGYAGATDALFLANSMNAEIRFLTNTAERMRIAADGKVGIGNTPGEQLDVEGVVRGLSPNSTTKGAVILRDAAGNPGACYLQAVSNNGVSEYSFIKMSSGTLAFSGNVVPNADGAVSCGLGSNRWNTIYAVTGTINTSDATTKRLLGSTDDMLLDAIGDIEIVLYQFLDAIEIKGEKAARHHAGITAQALQSALESRGIDPSQCAAFCADTLEDGSVRYGVRYTELLVLMQAWTRREMSRLVSRVAALEGA